MPTQTSDRLQQLECELLWLQRRVKALAKAAKPKATYSAYLDGTNDPEQQGQLIPINTSFPVELELSNANLGDNFRDGNAFAVPKSANYALRAAFEWELVNASAAQSYSVTFFLFAEKEGQEPVELARQSHGLTGQANSRRTQSLIALHGLPEGWRVRARAALQAVGRAVACRWQERQRQHRAPQRLEHYRAGYVPVLVRLHPSLPPIPTPCWRRWQWCL